MIFWTTFIIGTFDQNTFLLVRKSKKFWENVRIWEKMCHFAYGTYFSIMIFFEFFFRLQLPLRTFWRGYRAIFLIFCLIFQEIVFSYEKLRPTSKKSKNVSFCLWNLFFNFDFILFFSIPITFTNFLAGLSGHFFDFLSYMAGNCIFWCQI